MLTILNLVVQAGDSTHEFHLGHKYLLYGMATDSLGFRILMMV